MSTKSNTVRLTTRENETRAPQEVKSQYSRVGNSKNASIEQRLRYNREAASCCQGLSRFAAPR